MRWKHYFYFTQGEKLAIIILLVLIVIIGGTYIYTEARPAGKIEQDSTYQKEFDQFISQLKDKEVKEQEYKKQRKTYPTSTYQRQPKLEAGETIDLNTADTSALKQIPGIGSGYANRIVKYRNLLGGYASLLQLKEVWGMDDYLYAKIIPYIELTGKHQRIKINKADFKELNKHPYISYKQAQVIIDIRDRKGSIESIDRLSLLEEFNEKDIIRLQPYLSFD